MDCSWFKTLQRLRSGTVKSKFLSVFFFVTVSLLGLTTAPASEPKRKLYVANSAGNDIHVIDISSNQVLRRIEVGPEPHGLVATAAGDQIFITIENTTGEEGELVWLDPLTDSVIRRMKIGPRPNQLACTPDGK